MKQYNPLPSDGFVDDYAMERIAFRIRLLDECFELSEADREDLRHDMVVEVLSAARRFNPVKSKRETFINRVLDRFVKHAIRTRCTRMDRSYETAAGFDDIAPGYEPACNDPADGVGSEQQLREQRLDLNEAIARMPSRLQAACALLKVYEPQEVARIMGIRRPSIYRTMAQIRTHLVEAGIEIREKCATN